jgi:hypothetical protein
MTPSGFRLAQHSLRNETVHYKRWNADYQALEVRLSGTCTGFDLPKPAICPT